MKFFKKKNLLNVLYAVLISLPLFSILGRVLYTQWNQNAKDSYYGETINKRIELPTTLSNLKQYDNYSININAGTLNFSSTFDLRFYIDNGWDNLNNRALNHNICLYQSNTVTYFFEYDDITGNAINYRQVQNLGLSIDFEFVSITKNVLGDEINDYLTTYSYNNYSFLDNAFDYSISQFVSENDFGKLNFFTWFSDLFLSNNSVNNLYIHFVNWYLNYTLFVSLGFILFLVLMWFVNFARRILCRFEDMEL